MTAPVALDLGCCPAGSFPERTVRGAGGKAAVLHTCDPDDSAADPTAWWWRVAGLVGMHREAVVAGCPVPLAAELVTWAAVVEELASDRWDVVVLRVAPPAASRLLEAPDVLLRVLDARLDRLAAAVGDDRHAAAEVEMLLDARPRLLALQVTADAAAAVGHPGQHREHGCTRPGGLATATLDQHAPTGTPRPATGVRADGGGFVWWVDVPTGEVPQLHREADRLLVEAGGQCRTIRLPAALARCTAQAATVVGDQLRVRFSPDPDAWR